MKHRHWYIHYLTISRSGYLVLKMSSDVCLQSPYQKRPTAKLKHGRNQGLEWSYSRNPMLLIYLRMSLASLMSLFTWIQNSSEGNKLILYEELLHFNVYIVFARKWWRFIVKVFVFESNSYSELSRSHTAIENIPKWGNPEGTVTLSSEADCQKNWSIFPDTSCPKLNRNSKIH